MKFGKDFKKQKVPEWTDAYVDYNRLKRILHEIHKFKQNNLNVARGSQKRVSLFRDFGSSSLHDSNIEHQEDIENQVIAVQTLRQENSRMLYNTKLLVSEEGEENERCFFEKLDDELNKTNNFYKDKVEEVLAENALLKKQMETLMILRIKVKTQDFNASMDDVKNLAPSEVIPPDGNETVGEMNDKLTFQTSNRSQLKPGFSRGMNLKDQAQHFESNSEHGISLMKSPVNTSEDRTNKNECEAASLEILDRVKISNTFDTPISTIKGVFNESREKDLSYKKEELKEIEERLKAAFIQFYQKLCHLKQYSFVNLSAFSKILKKYEKTTSRIVARSYMKIVDDSFIGSSDEVTGLMERVEGVFIKNFMNSNRREGMKVLRPKHKIERHRITFCSGFLSGCTIALIVAIVLLFEDRKLMHIETATLYMDIIFPLYSLYAYIVLHMLVYGANIYFWRRYKINYPFIFGFKQGTELGYRDVFLLSNGLAGISLATLLVHLHIKMDSGSAHYETYIELLPLGLAIVVLAIIFCPFNIIYRSSRFYLIKTVVHCLCAPLYTVTLPDFFLADQLTSQIQAMRCVEYYICFYGKGKFSQMLDRCSSHDIYNAFYFVVAVIPHWFRFLQCVRRVFEEGDYSHGYNGLRYFMTIVAVVIRTAYETRKVIVWKVLALLCSAIATIANTYWDIVVDWGLLQRQSKNRFLRDKLLVANRNVYFIAMVLDILLRFAWLQLMLTFDVHSLRGKTISTIFSFLEILRRGLWNFFRLENEHLNNVGKYRAFRSVPFPFTYYEDVDVDEDEDEEDEDEDEDDNDEIDKDD